MTKVLISPEFGAGWSSWMYEGHDAQAFALTYKPLIEAIESDNDSAKQHALEKFAKEYKDKFDNEPYLGGARSLIVVDVQNSFIVEEYDGSESIQERDNTGWFVPISDDEVV